MIASSSSSRICAPCEIGELEEVMEEGEEEIEYMAVFSLEVEWDGEEGKRVEREKLVVEIGEWNDRERGRRGCVCFRCFFSLL